jgi:hypothetical protein
MRVTQDNTPAEWLSIYWIYDSVDSPLYTPQATATLVV